MTLAFEFAITPALFGGAGYMLVLRFDLVPVFTIVFMLISVIGLFVRTWYTYSTQLNADVEALTSARRDRPMADGHAMANGGAA